MERYRRGIFSRPLHAWLALGLYTGLLYTTLTSAYNAYIWLFERVGARWMSLGLNSAYLLLGGGLLALAVRRGRANVRAYAALALIAGAAALCLKLEEAPANRLHLIQYGPLAILALDALRVRLTGGPLYAGVLALVFLVGCGDELLQSRLPDRRFDPHDLVLNLTAGALSMLYVANVLGPENYPWGRSANRAG